MQTDQLTEEDKLLLRRMFDYIGSQHPQELNIESWYQELLEKIDRDEMEEMVFQTMDHLRRSLWDLQSPIDSNNRFYIRYFDWDTRPIHHWEYAFKLTNTNRQLGLDMIGNYQISTVWMGLDHAFFPTQPPLIFETMIFIIDETQPYDDELRNYQERYTYKSEAIAGHKEAIEYVRAQLDEKFDNKERGQHDG